MNKTQRFLLGAALPLLFAIAANAAINARITVTQAKLDSACGTHNIKVAFICQNQAYILDFSQTTPQIQAMAGVTNAYYPVISPEGQLVTYQTGVESDGASTSLIKGKVWMREAAATGTPVLVADSAFVPRFVLNTPVSAPEIVYVTSITCPQQICYTEGKTLKRKIVNMVPQAAEVICGSGSYYGGISWDNRYLCTGWDGGPNAFLLDLQNSNGTPRGIHFLHVKKIGTNADTIVRIGVCNISRSASRVFTNAMLYFDFGSYAVKDAGCYNPLLGSWDLHQKLFISRYDSEDLKVFETPADKKIISSDSSQGLGEAIGKEWDFPEWSNHPYYAVASLLVDRLFQVSGDWQHVQNREAIYLVNLKDSSYIKLLETTDTSYTSKTSFFYPGLNVQLPTNFVEDSTWLSKTIWERASQGIAHPIPINYARRNKTALGINAKHDPVNVTIYSVLGQKLLSMTQSTDLALNVDDMAKSFRSGIYFIGVSAEGKKQQIVRWVKCH